MGYWDKKDGGKKQVATSGKDINKEGLERLEKESHDSAVEMQNEIGGIAESIKRQKAQAQDLISSDYWFAVCFNNSAQKKQYLKSLGLNPDHIFIQAQDFVRAVNAGRYTEPDHDYNRERKRRDKLTEIAREIK